MRPPSAPRSSSAAPSSTRRVSTSRRAWRCVPTKWTISAAPCRPRSTRSSTASRSRRVRRHVVIFRPNLSATPATGAAFWQEMNGRNGMRNRQHSISPIRSRAVWSGHEMKFGLDYRRLAPSYSPSPLIPTAIFNSAAAVLAGVADQLNVQAESPAEPRIDNLSLFAQDTWRLSSRATLTYGVRWELNPLPSEATGLEAPLVIGIDTPEGPRLAPEGTPLYETRYTNFAPRLGMSCPALRRGGPRVGAARRRRSLLRPGQYLRRGRHTGSASHSRGPGSGRTFPWPVDPALLQAPPVSLTLPMSTWVGLQLRARLHDAAHPGRRA